MQIFVFIRIILHQGRGAVVLGLGDGADLRHIAVALAYLDGEAVAHFLAQHLFAEGGLLADQPLSGVAADGGDHLDDLRVALLRHIDLHLVKQPHLVCFGAVVNDLCRFDHPLQIADAAAIFVLGLLCGLVLKILAEIAEGPGALDLLDQLGHQLQPAVVQLLLHLFDVFSCQFVVHDVLRFICQY